MEQHYCEQVLEWELVEGEKNFSRPLTVCGKVARFQDDLGDWLCAEHWDQREAAIERLAKEWEDYDQGICGICNCEFHSGECNCHYYEFG